MFDLRTPSIALVTAFLMLPSSGLGAQGKQAVVPREDPRLARLKAEVSSEIDGMATQTQQMVDMIYSFGELGFQEVETSKYLTGILEQNGFSVERGVAGIPTAWVARWGSGSPVIALGSDIDGIPQSSQKPGVAYRDPIVVGAPGHGEGHNTGQPVNVTAALALKKIMERERLSGTIMLWPGVAEEQLGSKAYLVREGIFKDVDLAMFTHVGSNLQTQWGLQGYYNAILSAVFEFRGTAAHGAGAPWRGRSALDAVELMDIGWNFRREHLRPQQRSHYVIRDGGDQPNVVPATASVWYYLRETDYEKVMEMFAAAKDIAEGAARMTGTTLDRVRIMGSAWVPHLNKPVAEAMDANIRRVKLPVWDEKDHQLARAIQKMLGRPETGLDTALQAMQEPMPEELRQGGGSDDIGDVSWSVPTTQLYYPSNVPDTPGHHWSDAIAEATPIAHKGATAGAKVQAMTMLDVFLRPELVRSARAYFDTVQTKVTKYKPFMGPADQPAVELNAQIMERYRPEMRKHYFDPTRYRTYMEQLGISYPTVRP
ncbi:MAG: p-aminobenzoyl-glutamate hydrolase subunit B [Gemmatimonadaceae bacterium]|nr:p-aminobenzoyl-glutamate hydrolase subunit B [Gemmatimonadaceae bacterium]